MKKTRILPDTVPFDAVRRVVEKLEDCALRFNKAECMLYDGTEKDGVTVPGEYIIPMPKIGLSVEKVNSDYCKYEIQFSLSTVPYSPYFSDCQVSDFLKSEFKDYMQFTIMGDQKHTVEFNLSATSDEISRLITYHLQLLDYDNSICFRECFMYHICRSDLSKASFPTGFKAAQSIKDAFCDIREAFRNSDGEFWSFFLCGSIDNLLSEDLSGVMRFVIDRDHKFLWTSWEDVEPMCFIAEDEEEILRYHNHQCFDVYVDGLVGLGIEFPLDDSEFCCRLMTDYLINVKGLKREEIMAVAFPEDESGEGVTERIYAPEIEVDSDKINRAVANIYRFYKQRQDECDRY